MSVLLGLFSSLTACLEICPPSLNIQDDYVRRRLNIIRLPLLPISKASVKRLGRGCKNRTYKFCRITTAQIGCWRFQTVYARIHVDERKQFENAIVRREIFL